MSVGLQRTRDELGNEDVVDFIPKSFSEKFNVRQGPLIRETRDVGDDTIWGLFNWGESNWDGTYGSLFVLGSTTYGVLGQNTLGDELGELIREMVSNPNDIFNDNYDVLLFKDDVNTTADTSTAGEVNFTAGEVYQSKEIYKGDVNRLRVTINLTIDSGTFTIYAWSDDNTPEEVTNGSIHTLATAGKSLKYKVVESGASTGKITQIRFEYK